MSSALHHPSLDSTQCPPPPTRHVKVDNLKDPFKDDSSTHNQRSFSEKAAAVADEWDALFSTVQIEPAPSKQVPEADDWDALFASLDEAPDKSPGPEKNNNRNTIGSAIKSQAPEILTIPPALDIVLYMQSKLYGSTSKVRFNDLETLSQTEIKRVGRVYTQCQSPYFFCGYQFLSDDGLEILGGTAPRMLNTIEGEFEVVFHLKPMEYLKSFRFHQGDGIIGIKFSTSERLVYCTKKYGHLNDEISIKAPDGWCIVGFHGHREDSTPRSKITGIGCIFARC